MHSRSSLNISFAELESRVPPLHYIQTAHPSLALTSAAVKEVEKMRTLVWGSREDCLGIEYEEEALLARWASEPTTERAPQIIRHFSDG